MRITHLILTSSLLTATMAATAPMEARSLQIPTDRSQKAKPATIKVLLAKQREGVLLEVKGRYNIYNLENDMPISNGILGKRATLLPNEKGIVWGDLIPAMQQIRIVPGDSQATILVNGIQYRGCIEVYNLGGVINVVNEIDVETYLKSTLSYQFPKEDNQELMEALAIVARTNAYYFVSRNTKAYWHVDAKEVNYQGYAGVLQNVTLDRAIEMTRFAILTYNNAPFAATWTKDSAGKTAPFATIFRKNVTTPPGVEATPAARDRDKHHWTFTISKQDLANLAKVSKINNVEVYMDQNSNKTYAMRIKDGSISKDIDFFSLQKMIGANKLRSNDFTVSVKGDNVVFDGFGEGHGVGLCLYSAKVLTEKGEKLPNILASFFPNTKLEYMRTFNNVSDAAPAATDKR